MTKTGKETFKELPLNLIDRPEEISRMFISEDEIEDLARSIKERGLLQPIGVTPRGERYMIAFGDRRYLAHEYLKYKKIMCRIKVMDDVEILLDRAIENLQKVNLTPLEEGHVYYGLKEKAGMSLQEISKRSGKSPATIQRKMDILRMPDSFQKALQERKITVSVAEELWSCPDAAKREYFLELAVEHGITTMVARTWVQDYKKELRTPEGDDGGGTFPPMEHDDQPIYRACDICKGPCEYKDLTELRLCKPCAQLIREQMKN